MAEVIKGPAIRPRQATKKKSTVLCVDLDGTLLATDVLWESVLLLLKKQPWIAALLPLWLAKGKAHLKREIADRVKLNPTTLPIRKDVLEYLHEEKGKGRKIVLATASTGSAVAGIASHLGIFTEVLTSDDTVNLAGARKRDLLEKKYGKGGFDYIGDSAIDLPVWQAAKRSFLVQPSGRLLKRAEKCANVEQVFYSKGSVLKDAVKAIRVHQWVKNILIFVPLLMAHKVQAGAQMWQAVYAFIAFSLCASSVYILNDLFDLQSDREHPKKRQRPFAAGRVSLLAGFAAIPVLLVLAFGLAWFALPSSFLKLMAVYLLVTSFYSLYFKRVAILDIMILAALYSLRLQAGGLAVEVSISSWLLAFSMFLFLSLAFVKRYTELTLHNENGGKLVGRGYCKSDIEILRSMGAASGYISVLVLAFYVNSPEVRVLYSNPEILWGMCPLWLYWITRIWFLAHRGTIEDDPIVTALKDPVSYVTVAIISSIVILAL